MLAPVALINCIKYRDKALGSMVAPRGASRTDRIRAGDEAGTLHAPAYRLADFPCTVAFPVVAHTPDQELVSSYLSSKMALAIRSSLRAAAMGRKVRGLRSFCSKWAFAQLYQTAQLK